MSSPISRIARAFSISYCSHVARRSREVAVTGVVAYRSIGRRVRAVCAAEAYEMRLLVDEARARIGAPTPPRFAHSVSLVNARAVDRADHAKSATA